MHFAYPVSWWLVGALGAAVGALAFFEYRRPLSPLTRAERGVLVGLRAAALAALVVFLLRPIVLLPPVGARDAAVPVLVDVSGSMRLTDADGQARLARATTVLRTQLLPALSRHFKPEIYSVGERLASADLHFSCVCSSMAACSSLGAWCRRPTGRPWTRPSRCRRIS